MEEGYTEEELWEMSVDMDVLREYLNGLKATWYYNGRTYYHKKYVDTFLNR